MLKVQGLIRVDEKEIKWFLEEKKVTTKTQ